jgi:hypothetical protein
VYRFDEEMEVLIFDGNATVLDRIAMVRIILIGRISHALR